MRDDYTGPLYAEISPRSFSIVVRTGSRLVQLRIRRGPPIFGDTALRRLHDESRLVETPEDGAPIAAGDPQAVSSSPSMSSAAPTPVLSATRRGGIPRSSMSTRSTTTTPSDFWEPVSRAARAGRPSGLVLDPNDFYILASREAVVVPADHAAEMLAYDTLVGEFRVHYAGFFDPGFGAAETGGSGSRAVLEVRSHEVPFLIEHGQTIGRLVYEPLIARPDRLYGGGIGSSYQTPGPGAVEALQESAAALGNSPTSAAARRGGASSQ